MSLNHVLCQIRPKILVVMTGSIALSVVITVLWWRASPHDYRGRLVRPTPGYVYIPEDPPPAAWLVTASSTYELDIPRYAMDRTMESRLAGMDGQQAVVRGTLGYRQTQMRRHQAIQVTDLRAGG